MAYMCTGYDATSYFQSEVFAKKRVENAVSDELEATSAKATAGGGRILHPQFGGYKRNAARLHLKIAGNVFHKINTSVFGSSRQIKCLLFCGRYDLKRVTFSSLFFRTYDSVGLGAYTANCQASQAIVARPCLSS